MVGLIQCVSVLRQLTVMGAFDTLDRAFSFYGGAFDVCCHHDGVGCHGVADATYGDVVGPCHGNLTPHPHRRNTRMCHCPVYEAYPQ